MKKIRESPDAIEIAKRKRKLLEYLLEEEGIRLSEEEMIAPGEAGNRFPLSFSQQRLWFLDQLEPGNPIYNIPLAIRLSGHLDMKALERSLNEIVRRHEILRTGFVAIEGQPAQVVVPDLTLTMNITDLSHLAESEREDETLRLAAREARQGFDLTEAPLVRARLLRLSESEHALLLTMHHIISDGWSTGVFMREVIALYDALVAGKPSPLGKLQIQYKDFALWQRGWLREERLERQLGYWKEHLGGDLPALRLPTDRPRPAVQTYRGRFESLLMPKELSEEIKRLSRREDVTLFMALLAAFDVLLYRYSGQKDILIGTPIANRNREEIEGLIGFFVNTLVMRTDLSGDPTFRELLNRVREVALGAYAHQDLPFEKLVEELHPTRDMSRTPLFQVMFVLQNTPLPEVEISGLKISPLETSSETAKFDLTLSIDDEDGLCAALEYNTDLFEGSTIRRMLCHFQTLLEAIAANPQGRISRLPLMSDRERRLLIEQSNASQAHYPKQHTINELFERQVERSPDALALSFQDLSLTYQQLNCSANRLAHHLRSLGAGPESMVGILAGRSIEMVIAIIGVLKSGAAYVPLDPAYPKQRLEMIIADARLDLLITQQHLLEQLPQHQSGIVCLDRDWSEIEHFSDLNPVSGAGPDNPAYVIYTSGSTGKPKGVAVTHHNVARLFEATHDLFDFSHRDVWSLFHSTAFDFSVWELWGALLYGGKLIVVPFWTTRSPDAFYELLEKEAVTVLCQTPSAFRQLIEAEARVGPKQLHLRYVIFGGEALGLESLRGWTNRHGDKQPLLVNMYGITETTVHVTFRRISSQDIEQATGSLIGRAIDDLSVYLLDEQGQPVPQGVAAEICVGGAGLAIGYLNHPELTSERFIANEFSHQAGERLYRSGDLGRYLAEGEIEYLGRIDQQVKVRGFRVEPGEIEAALMSHARVKDCAVVARGQTDGQKRLAAYVVTRGEATASELREYLRERLPEYMVPAAIVEVERIALTEHGKVDRRALPEVEWGVPEEERSYEEPRSEIERVMAEIWSEVLTVQQVGIDDNYFALGGDSIRSIQVRAKARARGLDFSLQQLFQHQTIRELAEHLSAVEAAPAAPERSQQFGLISKEDRRKLPDDVEDAYPLSQLQAGMVFHSEFSPDYITYVSSIHLRFPLDVEKLQAALDEMAGRHEMLRTSFDIINFSEPLQLVHRSVRLPLVVEDLRHLSGDEEEGWISEWLLSEMRRKFDWTQAPLLRFHVHLRTDSIQFTMTEPFFDGWSVASFLTELFERYFALLEGDAIPVEPALEAHYRDFIELEREALQSENCRAYWDSILNNATACRLPRWPFECDSTETREVLRLKIPIPEEVSDGLKRLARTAVVSLKSVLLAAHMKVVSLLSGQSDALTGLLINGRPEKTDGERMLGAFLNTALLRLHVNGGTWIDLARQAFEAENELLPFRRYPIQESQRRYGAEKLVDTVFNYTHFHVLDRLRGVPGLEVFGEDGSEQTYFPLTAQFNIDNETSRINFALDYRSFELGDEQVKDIAGYYSRVLAAMADEPMARHDSLCLLSEQEQHRLLAELNDTRARFSDRCIHELFEEQAARTPDLMAVTFEDERLSHQELNRRANQLARYLRKLGVGTESLVGICMDRSLEMIVGVVGILKAGGAYLPLDPEYPKERLSFMLKDSQAQVVLTEKRLQEPLSGQGARVVCIDSDWPSIAEEGNENLPKMTTPDNLAYVIYTSGSTGKPKGVLIEHRGVTNVIEASIKRFGVSSRSRILQLASLSFDASVLEIFMALLGGAILHLVSRETVASGPDLADKLREHAITTIAIPPSLLDLIPTSEFPNLQTIIVGGEACGADTAARWSQNRKLFNAYAPTEATIYATAMECARGERQAPPIGRPISNTQVYLLDSRLQPVPVGVPGELHVGGVGVARGYLNRPELTAAFIPNPFSDEPGARLYKTGDLARYRADRNIEFLGRADHQVKVRGFRIELGEIETVLGEHEAVREAVVLAREDAPREKRLVAYVTTDGQAPTTSELRAFLKEKLPEYMLPSAFVMLDAMPLTATGKVDRNALPAPEQARPELAEDYVAPRTPIEDVLTSVWAQLFRIERVGIHDNFFELGGHSLLATQMVSRVRKAFQMELPLRALFQSPTIASFAKRIEEAIKRVPSAQATPIERAPRDRDLPPSFAQLRLWIIDQFDPGSPLYNIHAAVGLSGALNTPVLEKSIGEILKRHEALRTTFAISGEQVVQVINEISDWRLPVTDLRQVDENEREHEAMRIAAEEARLSFDLEAGPLVRAKLLRLEDENHWLLVTMHHIVSDGWSMGVFVRELAALYEAFSGGKPSPLEELPIQYVDFAVWQHEWLQGAELERQLNHWKKQLADSPPVLELPTDRPRPPTQTFSGAHESLLASNDLTEALKGLSRREGVTLFMTLLAAFDVLLYRYSGQKDILIGTPIANRNREEIEGLIGFFVNTLVMRTDLSGDPTFRELLVRVREVALGAYAHQDLPFEKLVEELNPSRDMSHTPLFQVMFDLQNAPIEPLKLEGLGLTNLPVEGGTAKFDLTLTLTESENELIGSLEYNTDLFHAATIKRMLEHFRALLAGATASPDEKISRLPILTEAETSHLLVEWNDTRADYSIDRRVHELFEQQAERSPDQTAIAFGSERLTYRKLNDRANKLARHLRRLGVGPESLVGISAERSFEMIVGLLGILKAGGAYVPLDPSYPKERLAFMLEDSRVKVLLSQNRLLETLPAHQAKTVCLDGDWEMIGQESSEVPDTAAGPDNLAYVIYTSGSTGKPKGVQVTHRTLAHSTHARTLYYREPVGSFLLLSSFAFDSSVAGIFWTLCGGAVLVIPDEDSHQDPARLAQLIASHNVSHLLALPSFYELLLEQAKPEQLDSLRVAIVAGEACPADLVNHHKELLPQASLFNEYGPTEATVWSSVYDCQSHQQELHVPIGRPIANTQIYLLDSQLQPVPIGVAGELYIGGDGLVRGYLNHPEQTAAAFTPNPFGSEPGTRLYKTGDVARFLPDGQIEFLSRNDFQIKIRGFRIELGEIEVALRHHPSIKDAAVVARLDEKNDKRLVAYVVAVDQVSSKQLRDYLKAKLPEYMLPAVFVMIDEMPLTASGKIDRLRLPDPKPTGERQSHVEPRTALERVIAGIWGEVLGVERVGVDEDFFELGGHSLIATQVASRVRDVLGAELALRKMFEEPTVEGVARVLVEDERERIERVAEVVMRLSELSDDQAQSLIEENFHPLRKGRSR